MVALLLLTMLHSAPAPPAIASSAQTPAPAPAQPARPRPAAAPATITLTIQVTDTAGLGLQGVTVKAIGPVDREAKTIPDGSVRLAGLRPGTYRLRFEREGYYTFEKEVSWRAGQPVPEVTATLTTAPPPPPPPPPPAPVPTGPVEFKLPPPGDAKTVALPDFIERNFISGKEPHKENLIGCSGVGQALLWQVRDPWEGRQHTGADLMLYVIGGDGSLKIDGKETTIGAGSFGVVPRGATYAMTRRGRNPLILLGVLAGAPCAAN
jgi:hypothetical protein